VLYGGPDRWPQLEAHGLTQGKLSGLLKRS
jgi:hypothetical protein